MQQAGTNKLRFYLKWILWILLAQFVLTNISAAIYAYKFTHFYKEPGNWDIAHPKNIFDKTWKLFKGPALGKNSNETLPEFSVETIALHLANGQKIEAWYSSVDSAKGTICLFHGLTLNKAYYTREASVYRSYGFNVLLIDFRGHGRSDGMETTIGYNEAEEVKLAYDFVKSKGEKTIYLFGGSMGAVAVARAVAVYKLDPSGIILDMPFDGLLDHVKARVRSFGFPETLFGYPVNFWLGMENSIPSFKFKTSTYAKDIHCPVLLQWGTADHLVKQKETESIYNSLASKNKKLVVYEDGSHSSFLAQDPEKWKREMETFLHLNNN